MSVFSVIQDDKDFMINMVTRHVHVYRTDDFGYITDPTTVEKKDVKKALQKHAVKGHITFSQAAEMGSNLAPQGVGNWSF